MNKFGLYVVDKSLNNGEPIGYAPYGLDHWYLQKNKTWKRTGIYCNGQSLFTTINETTDQYGLGTYIINNNLICNEEVVVEDVHQDGISIDNGTFKFGTTKLYNEALCVNITKNNYNKLRAGSYVEGYLPYSEDIVYYITDNVNTPVAYDKNLIAEHKDIIYNSFVNIANGGITDLHVNEPASSLITHNNFTDVRDVPEIAMRPFSVFIDSEDGVGKLRLEYYVDTAYYSSNCPECVDSDNDLYSGVGDTFTTIVENEYGEELFRRTTYAGQFKVTIPLTRVNNTNTNGNPITGKTWFTIRTIDNHGRESVTLYYKVVVRVPISSEALAALEALDLGHVDSEGKYLMDADDLTEYEITTFRYLEGHSSIETNPEYRTDADKATSDMRNEYFISYKNKLALGKLFNDKKKAGYTGIVLYNENNADVKDLNDANNTVYCLDSHGIRDITEAPAEEIDPETGIAPGYGLTINNYKLANPEDYPNSVFGAVTSYYIFKVIKKSIAGGGSKFVLCDPFTGDEIIPKSNSKYTIDDLYPYRITSNTKVKVAGVEYGLNPDETPYEWIRRDGAHIRRNSEGKILVAWTHVYDEATEAPCSKPIMEASTIRLRIKSLNSILGFMTANRDSIFAEGYNMYYYFNYRDVDTADRKSYVVSLPNDFVIDCNYCTLMSSYATDMSSCKAILLSFSSRTNTHVKNAKTVGLCGDSFLERAYLETNKGGATNTFWEGAKNILLAGSTLCSVDNVWVENSGGYEFGMGPAYKAIVVKPTKIGSGYTVGGAPSDDSHVESSGIRYAYFTNAALRYVDYSGNIHYKGDPNTDVLGDADVLVDSSGQSLLPTYCIDYTDGNARYTGPVVSDLIDISNSAIYCGGKNTSDDDVLHTSHKDGFKIQAKAGYPYQRTLTSKHQTLFLHFYDNNGTFIKSCRTNERAMVIPPAEAMKLRITSYALFDDSKTIVAKKSSSSDQWSYNLWTPEVYPWDFTNNCVINNCKVNISKASMIAGPAVNTVISNCDFIGCCAIEYNFDYNEMVHNNEDQKGVASGFSYVNCRVFERWDEKVRTYRILQQGMSERTNVINCTNIDIGGTYTRYYMDGCKFVVASCRADSALFNKFLGIVKNSTSIMRTVDSNLATGFTYGGSDEGVGRNSTNICYDPIVRRISINNCLFNTKKAAHPIYTRGYAYLGAEETSPESPIVESEIVTINKD